MWFPYNGGLGSGTHGSNDLLFADSQLELFQTFAFDNSTTVTVVTISVTLDGVTADSVIVTITQPGLEISYDENNIPVGQ